VLIPTVEKPTYQQVFEEFNLKLQDELVAHMCAKRFCVYNEGNRNEMGAWTIKKAKNKRVEMKNWQLAVRTFIRNMPVYSKDLVVRLERNKLFKHD